MKHPAHFRSNAQPAVPFEGEADGSLVAKDDELELELDEDGDESAGTVADFEESSAGGPHANSFIASRRRPPSVPAPLPVEPLPPRREAQSTVARSRGSARRRDPLAAGGAAERGASGDGAVLGERLPSRDEERGYGRSRLALDPPEGAEGGSDEEPHGEFAARGYSLCADEEAWSRPLERRSSRPARSTGILPGAVVCGKYRVTGVVRESGHRVSLRVQHEELRETMLFTYVAREALARPEVVGAFLRSARAALRIRSEHVARINDVGRLPSGAPYVVTEYLNGTPLDEVLRVRGALPPTEAVDIILQATVALAEVHSLGLVHGALVPSSFELLRHSDGSGLVKVGGFGAAAMVEEFLQGDPRGNDPQELRTVLPYVAPERLRFPDQSSPAVDIYSLGAILYELVTGTPAFRASTPSALLAAIAADPPTAPSALRPGLPLELDGIVQCCLEKDPASRYPTVADLALALRPLAAPESQAQVDRAARILARTSSAASVAPIVLVGRSAAPSTPPRSAAPSAPAAASTSTATRGSLARIAALGAGISAGGLFAGGLLVLALQSRATGVGGSDVASAVAQGRLPAAAGVAPAPSAGAGGGALAAAPAATVPTAPAPGTQGPAGLVSAASPTVPAPTDGDLARQQELAQRWWQTYLRSRTPQAQPADETVTGTPSRPREAGAVPPRVEAAAVERPRGVEMAPRTRVLAEQGAPTAKGAPVARDPFASPD